MAQNLSEAPSRDSSRLQRVLITGISGVGKSTVTTELARRGYAAVDADSEEFSKWVDITDELATAAGSPVEADRDWVWREDRIQALLAREDADMLFVSGCAANMGMFLQRFDHIVLLSAPVEVIAKRLQSRTTNTYGKQPAELARALGLKQSVEPLLRRIAHCEIDTDADLDAVVEELLRPLTRRSTTCTFSSDPALMNRGDNPHKPDEPYSVDRPP